MKSNYILGAAWAIIALLLLGLLVKGMKKDSIGKELLNTKIFSFGHDDENWGDWTDGREYDSRDIEEIVTDLQSISLVIGEANDNKIAVAFEGDAEEYCTISNNNGKLMVQQKKSFNGFSGPARQLVKIAIPADFDGKLNINCTSGSIKINGLKLEEAQVNAVSGSVKISDCEIDDLDCQTVSGSIKLEGDFGQIKAAAVSGSISLENGTALSKNSSFDSVSGSISLDLPKDSDYELHYSTTSGSFKDAIANKTGKRSGVSRNGNGSVQISVSTMSGSIKVQ